MAISWNRITGDAAWTEEEPGIGILVRNDDGEIMVAMAEGIGKIMSIALAELAATSTGLQWANAALSTGCINVNAVFCDMNG